MSVGQILDEVGKFRARHCVLTGGEPMIARGIHELAAELHAKDRHITIETAGTVAPGGIACDLASISPKLANSTPVAGEAEEAWIARHERTRLQPETLREWVDSFPFQLKFVASEPSDIAEIEALVAATGADIPPWKILLMPEGTSQEALDANSSNLLAICREKGYRFCDRLHVRLFGNSRGT